MKKIEVGEVSMFEIPSQSVSESKKTPVKMNIYSTMNSNVSLAKEDKTPSQINLELTHKNFSKMSQSAMA